MKRSILVLLLLFVAASLWGSDIYTLFPTLRYQLDNLVPGGGDDMIYAREKLEQYLSSMNSELYRGMNLVLLEDIYKIYQNPGKYLRVDGSSREWTNLPFILTDEVGDTAGSGVDLLYIKYFMDSNYNLYLIFKMAGEEVLSGKGERVYLYFMHEKDDRSWVEVVLDEEARFNFYRENKKIKSQEKISAARMSGDVFEVMVPLGEVFDRCGYGRQDQLFFRCRIEGAGETPVEEYTEKTRIATGSRNWALTLLLDLVRDNCFIKGDSITLALALANNWIYAQGDQQTRNAVEKDLFRHYYLYKEIIEWQQSGGIRYDLAALSLVPKVMWADRTRYFELENGVLTYPYYKEFVDTIDSLRGMRDILLDSLPARGMTLSAVVAHLEAFTGGRTFYLTDRERLEQMTAAGEYPPEDLKEAEKRFLKGEYFREYKGKKRRWDEFQWLNYQYRLYCTSGRFEGDCSEATLVLMNLYRMAGIPPASFQYEPVAGGAGGHNFPAYYSPYLKNWSSSQNIPGRDETKRGTLFFSYPLWHHMLGYKAEYRKDISTERRIYDQIRLGFDEKVFEEIFFSLIPERDPGFLIYSRETLTGVADSDGDGLTDYHEKQLALEPGNPDSDGDGLSDLWELESRYDPLDPHDPKQRETILLDGLAEKPEGIILAEGGEGIASVGGCVTEKGLYMAVTFETPPPQTATHQLLVNTPLGAGWLVRWGGGEFSVSEKTEEGWEPLETSGGQMRVLRDGEFLVPVEIFPENQVLYLRYYSGNLKSRELRLPLGEEDIYYHTEKLFKKAGNHYDKKDDMKYPQPGSDIKKIRIGYEEGSILVEVELFDRFVFDKNRMYTCYLKGKKQEWLVSLLTPGNIQIYELSGEEMKPLKPAGKRYDAFEKSGKGYLQIPVEVIEGEKVTALNFCTGVLNDRGEWIPLNDESGWISLRTWAF